MCGAPLDQGATGPQLLSYINLPRPDYNVLYHVLAVSCSGCFAFAHAVVQWGAIGLVGIWRPIRETVSPLTRVGSFIGCGCPTFASRCTGIEFLQLVPDSWLYDVERDMSIHCARACTGCIYAVCGLVRRQSPGCPTGPETLR